MHEHEAMQDKPASILAEAVPSGRPMLVIKQNESPFSQMEAIEAAEGFEQCEFKQGYLAQIMNGVDEEAVPKLHARPIFAKLTKKGIILQQNTNSDSILDTYPLGRIGVVITP